MPAVRLYRLLLLGIALAAAATLADAADDTQNANAQPAATVADFLILAIKPEGDDKDYKLVELGDTKVDANALASVVKSRSRAFWT